MSARRQFDDGPWARLSGADRGRLLWRVAELIERDTANLAALEAIDVGKPLGDPLMVDIPLAAETFRHFAGWADKVQGTTVPVPDFLAARDSRTRYASRSVWSVRLRPGTLIASWKIVPALAVGCTVVVKPPQRCAAVDVTPCRADGRGWSSRWGSQRGHGTRRCRSWACASSWGRQDLIYWPPEVGAEIAREAGQAFKRVTLELGGKSPQLILQDADVGVAPAGGGRISVRQPG
jgi:acyl-CoA reductase-like NAD-dependent aldehyde dehydrogenase